MDWMAFICWFLLNNIIPTLEISLGVKQYKTALNHLLKIDDAKKELASTVRKTISREVQNLCNDKDSVFRGSNIKIFSWKSAHKELQKNCPVTIDLMKIICGNNKSFDMQVSQVLSDPSVYNFL
jgi:hypothetical protein